jgi:hypothetical protein
MCTTILSGTAYVLHTYAYDRIRASFEDQAMNSRTLVSQTIDSAIKYQINEAKVMSPLPALPADVAVPDPLCLAHTDPLRARTLP